VFSEVNSETGHVYMTCFAGSCLRRQLPGIPTAMVHNMAKHTEECGKQTSTTVRGEAYKDMVCRRRQEDNMIVKNLTKTVATQRHFSTPVSSFILFGVLSH
jgi:hypothetical protein